MPKLRTEGAEDAEACARQGAGGICMSAGQRGSDAVQIHIFYSRRAFCCMLLPLPQAAIPYAFGCMGGFAYCRDFRSGHWGLYGEFLNGQFAIQQRRF